MLFDNPLFDGWYTDTMDIFRVENMESGHLVRQEARKVNKDPIPCRVYHTEKEALSLRDTAGKVTGADKLACSLTVDIRKGDEVRVRRGGALGIRMEPERYFAGGQQSYFDPVGGVLSGLEHKEVTLLTEEIVE